ncbi:MAG: hypothetical protein JRH20_07245 [Deltaproteobacteria bacterium]|nr:hypothetical protein [Deltaproteobacteria bacterium]
MKKAFAIVLLALLVCVSSAGCGPSLKRDEVFKPKRVREVMFNDECQLQSYFDAAPTPPKLLTQQNVSTDPRFAVGEATFELTNPKNLKVFWTILRLLYTKIPPLPATAKKIAVDLRYHLVGERTALPIGAKTKVEVQMNANADHLELDLPYHPCVGAFFYGREHYRIRARLGAE